MFSQETTFSFIAFFGFPGSIGFGRLFGNHQRKIDKILLVLIVIGVGVVSLFQ